MIIIENGNIITKHGSKLRTVAVLNNGYTHIGIDDSCYIILNGENGEAGVSSHIFPEALEALKQLPSKPS